MSWKVRTFGECLGQFPVEPVTHARPFAPMMTGTESLPLVISMIGKFNEDHDLKAGATPWLYHEDMDLVTASPHLPSELVGFVGNWHGTHRLAPPGAPS